MNFLCLIGMELNFNNRTIQWLNKIVSMMNIPNIPEVQHQQQQNEEDLRQPIPTTTQLINVIMRTALWMKDNKLSLSIECYDAIRYKLV